jgi:hypothetical protein
VTENKSRHLGYCNNLYKLLKKELFSFQVTVVGLFNLYKHLKVDLLSFLTVVGHRSSETSTNQFLGI